MNLEEQFEQAQVDARMLPERPDNATMLEMYGLFKQAWSGDIDEPRPRFTDLIGRAKWDAWSALKGLSREEAKRKYVELVGRLAN